MESFAREILIPIAGGAFILFPIWNTSPYLQLYPNLTSPGLEQTYKQLPQPPKINSSQGDLAILASLISLQLYPFSTECQDQSRSHPIHKGSKALRMG